jgi:hypothetical protein
MTLEPAIGRELTPWSITKAAPIVRDERLSDAIRPAAATARA